MATLVSIQIGKPQQLQPVEGDIGTKPWTTSFFKLPVAGPVWASTLTLEGDDVADRRHHGGRDKAVCVYSADHHAYWRDDLSFGEEFGGGAFGENFTVAGLDEDTVCVGDRWRVGDADFEVSQPRQPCSKLARRWKTKDLTARVERNGLTGWYLRVIQEGAVTAGDPVERLARPLPEWTIARANEVMHHRKKDREATAELAGVELLANSWRGQLRRRLAKL
ncbi:MAG: MOSC domain-containing protein [Planctomycetota bacterium]